MEGKPLRHARQRGQQALREARGTPHPGHREHPQRDPLVPAGHAGHHRDGTRRLPAPPQQLITLTIITALLTTTLCIIRDIDRPFGGIINEHPTAITAAERQADRDFSAATRPPTCHAATKAIAAPPDARTGAVRVRAFSKTAQLME
ncbi:hypothetical protein ACIQOF_35860 [Streptomyces sp. NPDC091265]|uniref:hypothetical protein n=1 Tax=unclassified Streptomyces TaxID=2593676 RepID=UPI00344E2209